MFYRTQEVAGSSPASSISWSPCFEQAGPGCALGHRPNLMGDGSGLTIVADMLEERSTRRRRMMSTALVVLAVSTGVVVIVVAVAVVLVVLFVTLSMRGRQRRGAERRDETRRDLDEAGERAGRQRARDTAREAGEDLRDR
jgi:hypothetical protein